jgi:hypothetical protein
LSPKKESDKDVSLDGISVGINQQDVLTLPLKLKAGQFLYCDGQTVKLYDKGWQLVQTASLSAPLPTLNQGKNIVNIDGTFSGDNAPDVKIELRLKGKPELLKAPGAGNKTVTAER